jgi:hypothetical protein
MQGLGKGPDQVLAGTSDGSICILQDAGLQPVPRWVLSSSVALQSAVRCMAATEDYVVAGYDNGSIHVMRMQSPLPQLPTWGPPDPAAPVPPGVARPRLKILGEGLFGAGHDNENM